MIKKIISRIKSEVTEEIHRRKIIIGRIIIGNIIIAFSIILIILAFNSSLVEWLGLSNTSALLITALIFLIIGGIIKNHKK